MSTEADIAEIKTTILSIDARISDYVKHSQQMCSLMHKEINEHLKDAPHFRDKVNVMGGQIAVVLAILGVVLIGVMGIAYFVIQKVLA